MLCSTSTILILALQTTLTIVTALERFPGDKYDLGLLPRMDVFSQPGAGGSFKKDYTEVHPCATAFESFWSLSYAIPTSQPDGTPLEHTLADCAKIESSAAWWSANHDKCVPLVIGEERNLDYYPDHTPGHCFMSRVKPDKTGSLEAWKHPCEAGFSPTNSRWYTGQDMTFDKCKTEKNAGAWLFTYTSDAHRPWCFVFFGSPMLWHQPENTNGQGHCYILNKVTVHQSGPGGGPTFELRKHLEALTGTQLKSLIAQKEISAPSAKGHRPKHKLIDAIIAAPTNKLPTEDEIDNIIGKGKGKAVAKGFS